ncbi:MAG: cytochrome c peroxidase [Geothermobacteraceae bacterium]
MRNPICFLVLTALGFAMPLLLPGGTAMATETPNLDLGKALFESTALSTNGKSCASCHPDGKGLQEIDAYDDDMLREMINFCIRDALKGKMLPNDAQELESMRLFLRSLKR